MCEVEGNAYMYPYKPSLTLSNSRNIALNEMTMIIILLPFTSAPLRFIYTHTLSPALKLLSNASQLLSYS